MQLVGVYARVVSDADAEQDNDMLFDQGFHILQPIIRLLEACSNIPKLMSDLEQLLLPVLQDICNRCPEDLFEQVPFMSQNLLCLCCPASPNAVIGSGGKGCLHVSASEKWAGVAVTVGPSFLLAGL